MKSFTLPAFALMVMPLLLQAQVHHTVAFETSDLTISNVTGEDGRVYARLMMRNLQRTNEPGNPELPVEIREPHCSRRQGHTGDHA